MRNINQTEVTWSEAIQISTEVKDTREKNQEDAIKDFLESNHEMTDSRDLEHYINTTGKDLKWLLTNGTGFNSLLNKLYY